MISFEQERQEKVKEETKNYLRNPRLWPHRPFFPVTRKTGPGELDFELGVVFSAGKRSIVYLTNLFMLPSTIVEFVKIPKLEYNSIEEMVNDGWIGD